MEDYKSVRGDGGVGTGEVVAWEGWMSVPGEMARERWMPAGCWTAWRKMYVIREE